MHRFTRWFVRLFVVGLVGLTSTRSMANGPGPEYLTVRNGLPQGYIKSMIQDRRGFIWLATRDGLCRYDGVRFRVYNHDPQRLKSLSFSSIYEIKEDTKGRLWIRTENNNVDCFDPVTEQSERIADSPDFRQALGRDLLVGMQPDQSGSVWVATQTNGFFRLHPNGTVSDQFWPRTDVAQRFIRAILLDRQGKLWIAAKDGLFRYDPVTKQFTGYRIAQGLPQNDVLNLHERANGELMLGFPGRFTLFNPVAGSVRQGVGLPGTATLVPVFAKDYQGIDYVNQNRYTDQDGLIPLPSDPKLSTFSALSLLVDRSNVLWIGLNGDGVIKYDLNKRLFNAWPAVTNFYADWMTQQFGIPASALPPDFRQRGANAIRHQFDRRNTLWLSNVETSPYRYNAARKIFETVRPTGIEARWLPGGLFRLTALAAGPQGEVWGLLAPNSQAVVRHNSDLQTFTAFPLSLPPNHPYKIMAMVVDGGRIYLATQNHGLLRADLSTKRLVRWFAGSTDPQSLPTNALLSLVQDPAQYNHLWIGTFGNGLCRFDKLTGQIRRFTVSQGLPSNVVYAIRPDKDNHLWLSTNRGLCRFDSRTFEIRSYTADDGLPNEEFNRFYDVALPDGRLIFGGVGGYTIFDPRRVSEDSFKPVVALTALHINNKLVNATDPDSPIQRNINETPELVLNHRQNFLSFDFAALEFNQSGKNQYRYKLTGLDKDWVYSGNQATATYTNLPPATYTFVVNASNTSGVWSPHTRQIRVVIEPPLWATWWAYLGYVLLLLGVILLFLRIRIHRVRLKSRMELREQESIQLKNLDEIKSRFFANITHEFRTPLTLILTPLEQLLHDTIDAQQHSRLTLVYRNANRLLRLINELLDLAKLDAGSMTVTPAPGDLSEFVERTVHVFDQEAQRKRIRLRVHHQLAQSYYWFDTDKVDKVINNLVSNALKFTGENGLVEVIVSAPIRLDNIPAVDAETTPADRIRLTVRDTGIGINADKLPHIFNRFYQAHSTTNGSVGGSGIGLALVKELVEIMNGSIVVESQPGVGTTFIVEFPCRPTRAPIAPVSVDGQSSTYKSTVQAAGDAPRLLLVEDNDDIAEYVTSILGSEWRVQRASNGLAGVAAALANGPDLIISDVLMPEMNGYELCQALKTNPVTSHIPIILLTAKAALESRMEGLSAGADDYLAKPFQVDELRGRVRNRLEQQQRTRQHYRTQLLREGHLPTVSSAPQDDFMNRVYAVLETRLDDTTFGVEPLADAVGMSRMHLNRKVKAMTGMTPNELIRVVRLNRAAELLLTGVAIAEVADLVGFDTAAYFSKVFKEQYRLTPSEYVEKNRQEVT